MPGTLIKKVREQKKISQEEVARRIGMSQNAYSKIENNITQLTINHVKQISVVLEVSPLELIRGDFEVHKPLSLQAQSVTKDTILLNLDALREKIDRIHVERHELYPILMYEIQALHHILSHID